MLNDRGRSTYGVISINHKAISHTVTMEHINCFTSSMLVLYEMVCSMLTLTLLHLVAFIVT